MADVSEATGGLAAYEAVARARERKGGRLVLAIVVVNAVLTVLNTAGSLLAGFGSCFRVLVMLFWLFVYFMLYLGRTWARWLFVAVSVLSGIAMVAMAGELLGLLARGGIACFAVATSVLGVIAMGAGSGVLLFSCSVADFLYGQETGG